MSGVQIKTTNDDEEGMRLDRWFKVHFPQVRHGMLEKFIRKGQVRVDGGRVKASTRLVSGQDIRIPPIDVPLKADKNQPQLSKHERAENKKFIKNTIIYEDAAIMVLNKPHGLAVQGGTGTTVHIDGMLEAFDDEGERPRLVHRLDRDTGGVLVLAKTRKAAARLGEAFQKHRVEKTYWALTAGVPRPREGTIDMPVAKKMLIHDGVGFEKVVPAKGEEAKKAVSDFQTMDDAGAGVGFIALRPRTGRTHQLRVHCAAIGVPVVGDGKYGGVDARIEGISQKLHLHCRAMSFAHPVSGQGMTFIAPLQSHMYKTWKFFGFDLDVETEWPENI